MAPIVVALVLAQPSHAIDPGVNYDPTSPAGKEYAIPIVIGRAEGAGTEDQRAAANTPFGVGITAPGARGGRSEDATGGGTNSPASGQTGLGSSSQPSDGMTATERRDAIARAEEPADAGIWTLGIWLAVLLPAAAIALGLRGGRAQAAS